MKIVAPEDQQFNRIERVILAVLSRLPMKWKTLTGTGAAFLASILLALREAGVEWGPPWLPYTLGAVGVALVPYGLAHKIARK